MFALEHNFLEAHAIYTFDQVSIAIFLLPFVQNAFWHAPITIILSIIEGYWGYCDFHDGSPSLPAT